MGYLAKIKNRQSELESRTRVLPERLKLAIQDQQERSEVLISVIQLLVVSIFGLLYMVSPKTFSDDVTFTPVPWVLGVYLAFSLLRLSLSIKRELPDWMLYLSAIADITLLMGLIWSFHVNTTSHHRFI